VQLCVKNPRLDIRWIQFILAQTGLLLTSPTLGRTYDDEFVYSSHLGSVEYFLGNFLGLGFWPSDEDGPRFAWSRCTDLGNDPFSNYHLQVHFRCFRKVDLSDLRNEETAATSDIGAGFSCRRQTGRILAPNQKRKVKNLPLHEFDLLFQERRISVYGLLSSSELLDKDVPPMYRVLMLADEDIAFGEFDGLERLLSPRQGLEGIITFQKAISLASRSWAIEWDRFLKRVDEHLMFQLKETTSDEMATLDRWMFDTGSRRFRMYFTALQFLRIAKACISTTTEDLRRLDDLFSFPRNGLPHLDLDKGDVAIQKQNWRRTWKDYKDAETRLLEVSRIRQRR